MSDLDLVAPSPEEIARVEAWQKLIREWPYSRGAYRLDRSRATKEEAEAFNALRQSRALVMDHSDGRYVHPYDR